MAMVRKKQDDKYLEALRELITTGGGNRQCFDCGQKGPTYVNMTIGSFVCTRCSGVLRGLTPPHRVKSISMATFTQDEIDFLKAHGNDVCAKTWLGLWDPKRAVHQDQRELMIDKYERKRYYLEPASPLKSLTNATNLKSSATAAAAATSASSSSSSSNSNNNRSSSSNNNNNNSTQIQLTPPTSQRTTANGLHKSSSSAISRPHHSTPQQNGFNVSSSHTDAFGLHNGLNTSVGSASTGALSDTSSCASANGFGAEADFVADFGSADIFNATVASSPASSIGSASTNGYAKIQPLKAAHQQFMNGHGGNVNNGNGLLVNGTSNGFGSSPASNGNTENFADFDHAPIYNAAEESNYQFVRKNAVRKKSLRSDSLTIKPNERQLKDILEMDNPLEDLGQQQQKDYMEFSLSDEVYKQRKDSTDFNNILEDFEKYLTLKQNEAKYQQTQQQSGFDSGVATTKFTPLALAAHATAMAVLGNANHFNTNLTNTGGGNANSQWDVWSTDSKALQEQPQTNPLAMATTTAPWQSETFAQAQQQPQQQQPQRPLYGSLANSVTGNLALDYHQQQQQQQRQQQQLLTNTSNNSSYNVFANASSPFSANSSASIFDTAAPTVNSAAVPSPAAPTLGSNCNTITTTTTSRSNSNTNPFRNAHLDVNDNNATDLFDNSFNRMQYNDNNFNNNVDFNADTRHNYDFITNLNSNSKYSSIYDFHCGDNFLSQSDDNTNLINNNINNNNPLNNVNNTNRPYMANDNIQIAKNRNNPFTQDSLNDDTTLISSNFSHLPVPYTNPSSAFDTAPPPPLPHPFRPSHAPPVAHLTHVGRSNDDDDNDVVDDNANFNAIGNVGGADDFYHRRSTTSHTYSYKLSNATTPTSTAITKFNDNDNNYSYSFKNNNHNSYCIDNDNENNNKNIYENNSWRLPMSNGGINSNRNSTTNSFNNNNNNNNNTSAPAEDRYAALKDLDEQLRESKAVAAQAASIVTANVVDSGFGNPNNGTVNPFATHAAVANPFQNAANQNNPQNTTQLFGQMTLIPNGIAAANGFLNAQKQQPNGGFFNYTANGFTNAANNSNAMYPATMPTTGGPNGCGFGFGTLQQQIAATGPGLTAAANTFNNPFAASGAMNSNNPFL